MCILYIFSDSEKDRFIRFEDDGRVLHGSKIDLGGVPFIVAGCRLMECHQGPNRSKSKQKNVRTHNVYANTYY